MGYEIQAQDVIDAIIAQREAALTEMAKQAAYIKTLERHIEQLTSPSDSKAESVPLKQVANKS